VIVKDRIPYSMDDQIKVQEIVLVPEPEKREQNGIVTWRLDLQPDIEQKIKIGYQVEYPEDLFVNF